MAVKTTKIQCNQDVDVRGKVDIEGKVTCGGDAEVDGVVFAKGQDISLGADFYKEGIVKGIFYDDDSEISVGHHIEDDGEGNILNCYLAFYIGDSTYPADASFVLSSPTEEDDIIVSMRDVYKAMNAKYFRHSLTLTCGTTATYYIDYYSKNNLPADSLQDLSTITGNHPFGCGSAQATFTSNIWKIGETAITAVADSVTSV